MTVINTRITVSADGAIFTATPIPTGEYEATLTVAGSLWPGKPFTMDDFPVHDMGWDDSISLRREDIGPSRSGVAG